MSEDIIDDLTLWRMLQAGDSRGIDLIYQRHYPLMLNYGLKLCADREIVKDAIQDIFVKLHLAKKISTPISPRSYLLKAVRNTIYDRIDEGKRYLPLENSVFDIVDIKADQFDPDDEDTENLKILHKAYNKLNLNQKQIIYLRYVKDFSYNEISDIMNINCQSAMNLVQRSLVKLRSLMSFDLNILILLGIFF